MLFLDKNASKKGQRLDTRVYCCWTCLGKSEERERRDRQRERETVRERQKEKKADRKGVVSYRLCLWSKNKKKKAAAAKHVYKLVYKSKTAQEKKLTNETRDFEPMQSAALPCVQW